MIELMLSLIALSLIAIVVFQHKKIKNDEFLSSDILGALDKNNDTLINNIAFLKLEKEEVYEEKIKNLERQNRVLTNKVSVMESKDSSKYEKDVARISKSLSWLKIREHSSREDKVSLLSKEEKVKLYNHYSNVNNSLKQEFGMGFKIMSFEEFVDPVSNVKIVDYGEDWKKHGFAQREVKQYSGIYDWHWKNEQILN